MDNTDFVVCPKCHSDAMKLPRGYLGSHNAPPNEAGYIARCGNRRQRLGGGSCLGAGTSVGRSQGGARWNNRGRCPECGKDLALTSSGRIPRHVPAQIDGSGS